MKSLGRSAGRKKLRSIPHCESPARADPSWSYSRSRKRRRPIKLRTSSSRTQMAVLRTELLRDEIKIRECLLIRRKVQREEISRANHRREVRRRKSALKGWRERMGQYRVASPVRTLLVFCEVFAEPVPRTVVDMTMKDSSEFSTSENTSSSSMGYFLKQHQLPPRKKISKGRTITARTSSPSRLGRGTERAGPPCQARRGGTRLRAELREKEPAPRRGARSSSCD